MPGATTLPWNSLILLASSGDLAQDLVLGVEPGGGVGAQLVGAGDDGHLACQGVVHVHQGADAAEDHAGSLQPGGVGRLVEGLLDRGGGGEDRGDGDLLRAALLQALLHPVGPVDELLHGQVGAAHEAELGGGIGIFPHDGIIGLDPGQLRVIDDIDLGIGQDQVTALLLGLGGEVFDMVQAHGTVGGGGGTEILQVGAVFVVQLGAQPLFHAHDIRHIFRDFHADGGAQELGFGLVLAADLHDPAGLAALIGEQAEVGDEAGDRAHDIHDAGVAVAPGTQDGVGIDHGGALRPAQDLALLGLVAHLV